MIGGRLLSQLRLQDRVLGVEILAVEGCALLGPHGDDEADRFLHLADAGRGAWREFPAILAVFGFEPGCADAECQTVTADQVRACGDLR